MEFGGAGHVAEHVINDAAGHSTIGEAAGGVARGIAVEITPCFAAIGAAQDALAAVQGAGEHEVGFVGVDVKWVLLRSLAGREPL